MKWKMDTHGDERTRSFFAWFPVCADKENEARWLERVRVRERFHVYNHRCSGWSVVEFITDVE